MPAVNKRWLPHYWRLSFLFQMWENARIFNCCRTYSYFHLDWKSSVTLCTMATPPALYTLARIESDPGALPQASGSVAFLQISSQFRREAVKILADFHLGKTINGFITDHSRLVDDIVKCSAHLSNVCLFSVSRCSTSSLSREEEPVAWDP